MNAEFLKRMMWEAHYILKPGTTSSYINSNFSELTGIADSKERKIRTIDLVNEFAEAGKEMLLPITLSFVLGELVPTSHTGRGARQKVGQMKGNFTKIEVSPYKLFKTGSRVNTAIWQVEGRKCLFYGTLGVVLEEGMPPKDNGDLILFYTSDWKKVGVYIFKGMGKPNNEANLDEVVEFLYDKIV